MNNKLAILTSVLALGLFSASASAGISGWTTVGHSGVSNTADGVVTVPSGYSSYDYISTNGGVNGNNAGLVPSATNGTTVDSNIFSAVAGSALSFSFNYITSDGSGYPDYAWAQLYSQAGNLVANLFTAQTNPSGNTVPGINVPLSISGVLTPSFIGVSAGTEFSPLGIYSGSCYAEGCGNTGWVKETYTVANAGQYYLEFGVANVRDSFYDSALAWSGAVIDSDPIGNPNVVPEPEQIALLLMGLPAVLGFARRKQQA